MPDYNCKKVYCGDPQVKLIKFIFPLKNASKCVIRKGLRRHGIQPNDTLPNGIMNLASLGISDDQHNISFKFNYDLYRYSNVTFVIVTLIVRMLNDIMLCVAF